MAARNLDGRRAETSDTGALSRLEFEMALQILDIQTQPWPEAVRQAAQSVGGDLLFVLPLADAEGATAEQALVRFREGDANRIVHVCLKAGALAITDQPEIDAPLLEFARASIDVLERLRADERIVTAAA